MDAIYSNQSPPLNHHAYNDSSDPAHPTHQPMPIAEWIYPTILAGIVQGVIFWSAARIELRWLHTDVERLQTDVRRLSDALARHIDTDTGERRRADDLTH